MTEDEYWQTNGDSEDDDEILGDFLIEEIDDDLTLVMMPKIIYDYEKEFEVYYKLLKKCKNKEQMKDVLSGIISHASAVAVLQHDIKYLQDRAKDLEFSIQLLS